VSCPYAQAITDDGHDHVGTDGRTRCTWCDSHDRRAGTADTKRQRAPAR
jgi:hypothetical protein